MDFIQHQAKYIFLKLVCLSFNQLILLRIIIRFKKQINQNYLNKIM